MEYIQYPSYFTVSESVAVFVANGLHYENLFWLYLSFQSFSPPKLHLYRRERSAVIRINIPLLDEQFYSVEKWIMKTRVQISFMTLSLHFFSPLSEGKVMNPQAFYK